MKEANNRFTLFHGFNHPVSELTMEEIVMRIRGDAYQSQITEIRTLIDARKKEEAERKKRKLHSITFAARYIGGRKDVNIVDYTGHVVIDIDNLTTQELSAVVQVVNQSPYTMLSFVSPKGCGLKIVARVSRLDGTLPESIREIKTFHAVAYNQVAAHYTALCGAKIDTSGKDVGRTCFFSHDANAYYNAQASTLIINTGPPDMPAHPMAKQAPQTTAKATTENTAHQHSLLVTLWYYYNKSETYKEGNRNNYLFKLACQYNRYGVSHNEALTFIGNQFSDLPAEELNSLLQSAYSHTEEHNTCRLNDTQKRILHMEQYINRRYDLRYNTVRCCMEYREKSTEKSPFILLDERTENSIWTQLNEAGHACSSKVVQNLLFSDFSDTYHPIRAYLDELPAWDGNDHIGRLAQSVVTTAPDFWRECLERYLVAMIAAATTDTVVNHTVLLLCGGQNVGKTTFINNLLPPQLHDYLSTGLINPLNKDDLARVAQSMLINLDEFEGMTGREMNLLKDLITRKVISIRLPYARRSQNFPHTASFAGTCNYPEVLHDTTGNRRFLCFTVSHIEFIQIDYAQLYAQLKHLLHKPGYRYWFTPEENHLIEENNANFIFHTPEEELLLTHIRKPEQFEPPTYLTVSEIAELIRERTGYLYSTGAKIQMGRILSKHKFEYVTSRNGRRYSVYVIDIEQIKSNRFHP